MLRPLLLLVLALPARADDIRKARELLSSGSSIDRRSGIEMLVRIGSSEAVDELGKVIRAGLRELDLLAGELAKADADWLRAWRRTGKLVRSGMRGTAEFRASMAEQETFARQRQDAAERTRREHAIVVRAGRALGELTLPAAGKRIEAGARGEADATARLFHVRALRHVPALLALLGDGDARVRAAAVRTLIPFAEREEVRGAARPLGEDGVWAVRLGAHRLMACAPFAEAVEYLANAAAREDGEIAASLDAWLEHLTGRSFRQSPRQWKVWFQENAGAIRNGTYVVPEREDPEEGDSVSTFFRIPIESRNLVFVLDFSGSMQEALELHDPHIGRLRAKYGLPETRLGYAKAELIQALNGLPDGARFNLIGYSDEAVPFSRKMVELSKGMRKRAVDWMLRVEPGGETNLWEGLRHGFGDYLDGGPARFERLPDTMVLLTDGHANCGRFRDEESLRSALDIWGYPLDMVIHAVGLGGDQDRELLRVLAGETGGFYVDLGGAEPVLEERRRWMPGR